VFSTTDPRSMRRHVSGITPRGRGHCQLSTRTERPTTSRAGLTISRLLCVVSLTHTRVSKALWVAPETARQTSKAFLLAFLRATIPHLMNNAPCWKDYTLENERAYGRDSWRDLRLWHYRASEGLIRLHIMESRCSTHGVNRWWWQGHNGCWQKGQHYCILYQLCMSCIPGMVICSGL